MFAGCSFYAAVAMAVFLFSMNNDISSGISVNPPATLEMMVKLQSAAELFKLEL